MAPEIKLFRFFAGVLYLLYLNCSKTNGRNSRTNVASYSLTDQGLTWLFAIGCETIQLKHATLLEKLPINADNTSRGVAWMKWKGAVFLQGVQIQMRHFWEDFFDEVLPNQIETLGQNVINPKRTTHWSVIEQRNVSHSTVGIVASGYAWYKVSILKVVIRFHFWR